MDTPKRVVSWLESFPPDIWAYFAWYLPGEQLERLMMTGATTLRLRVTSSKVVKSIKLGQESKAFNSCPRFLKDFPSLDELSIYYSKDVWSRKFCLKIDQIPSGVRKLELNGERNHPCALFGQDDTTLKLNELLPHLETLDMSRINLSTHFWMAYSPQSLTKLSIRHWNGEPELPSTLVDFEAGTVTLEAPSFLSKLPPSLESFVVRSELHGVDLVVPLLPSSTRKLSLGRAKRSSVVQTSPQNFLEQLPKSLTYFQIPRSTEINFETNPELTSLLPSTLTELNILPDFPSTAWSLLPRNLTRLSLKPPRDLDTVAPTYVHRGVHYQATSFLFGSLPCSITSLALGTYHDPQFCGPPIAPNTSYFPSQLTSLKIRDLQLSPETAKLLPSSLTYLDIGNFTESVCRHLPRGLKTLIAFQTMLSPHLIKFLPRSLTFLDLSAYPGYGYWFRDCGKPGKRLESAIGVLEHSVSQNCVRKYFKWDGDLPHTLTHLRLAYADNLGDLFMLHQQLPNLLELMMEGPKHFTDRCIPLLSPHLTTLDFRSSSQISGKSFEFLPRNLTHINLDRSESIFDSDIQHLPRTLKYVHFSKAIRLSDLCICDLPPRLEKLDLKGNSLISLDCAPDLPHSLVSSQLEISLNLKSWYIGYGLLRVK